jgi:hypothetical protein
MKRIFLFFVICILVATPLQAQSFDKFAAQVGAGFTLPLGPTHSRTSTGWGFNGAAGPRLGRNVSLLFDVSFNKLDVKTLGDVVDDEDNLDVFDDVNEPFDANMKMWGFAVNPSFEYVQKERWSGFVQGGYGVYNRKLNLKAATFQPAVVCDPWWDICTTGFVTDDEVIGESSTWKGGFNIGTGFTFGQDTKFFFEARYHHVFTTNLDTQIIPITFGVRW